MGLIMGFYLADNHNALVMARDAGFLAEVPFHAPQFIDADAGRKRINFVKGKVAAHLPAARFGRYHCSVEGVNDVHAQFVQLKGLERFAKQVTDFVRRRIEAQYRFVAETRSPAELWDLAQTLHLRRNPSPKTRRLADMATKVCEGVRDPQGPNVLVIQGDEGSGRTAALLEAFQAALAGEAASRGPTSLTWPASSRHFTAFVHCPRAGPDHFTKRLFLLRTLASLFRVPMASLGRLTEDKLATQLRGQLLNHANPPLALFVDDPLDMVGEGEPMDWLPRQLPHHIRLVVTMPPGKAADVLPPRGASYRILDLPPMELKDAEEELAKWMHHTLRGAIPGIAPRPHRSALPKRPALSRSQSRSAVVEAQPKGDVEIGRPKTARPRLAAEIVHVGLESAKEDGGGALERTSTALVSATGLRRHAALQDVEEMLSQEGRGGKIPEWVPLKARVLGALLRFGLSRHAVKAAAQLPLAKVLELELVELESNLDGHVSIGVLCCLATSRNGLRELELRQILHSERHFVPEGLTRRRSTVGFNLVEGAGWGGELGAGRWRQAELRLRHHLAQAGGDGENRLVIASSAMRHAVRKRYLRHLTSLSSPVWRRWWEGLVWERLSLCPPERRAEEVEWLDDDERLQRELSRWDLCRHLAYHRPLLLKRLWQHRLGGLEEMERCYTDLLRASSGGLSPAELFKRTRLVAIVMAEAGLHRAAVAMADGALLLQTTAQPRPHSVAALHSLKAHALHSARVGAEDPEHLALPTDLHGSDAITRHLDAAHNVLRRSKDKPHQSHLRSSLAEVCLLRAVYTPAHGEPRSRRRSAEEAAGLAKVLPLRVRVAALRLQMPELHERMKRSIVDEMREAIVAEQGDQSPLLLRLWWPLLSEAAFQKEAHAYEVLQKRLDKDAL